MGFTLKTMDANRACKLGGLVLLLILVCWGTVLRSQRLDFPPLDFPADRQKSYSAKIDLFNEGVGVMDVQGKWLELRLLPWMVSKTGFVGDMFGWEIWTQSRIYSVGLSAAMIFMLGLCGYLSGGLMGFGVPRRVMLGLTVAAMLVFNPFHIYLSRLILAEPVTLCFQTGALLFLLLGMRRPKGWYFWLGCVGMLALAGLAKIPSFIWCPAIFLGFVFHPKVDWRLKAGGTAIGALTLVLVFLFYRLNPLTFLQEFANHYQQLDVNTNEWAGHPIWNRAYLGRVVMMLGLPVAVLAVVGCFVGPWIYRLTFAIFLVMFYRLLNLNTYNFAHVILPGTMLAAHGLDWVLNTAIRRPWSSPWVRGERCAEVTEWAFRAVLIGLAILWLAPRGPQFDYNDRLRLDAVTALNFTREEVPEDEFVSYDDGTGLTGYYVNHMMEKVRFWNIHDNPDTINTRYFFSRRFRDASILQMAGKTWVARANMHYEPIGTLFDRQGKSGFVPAAGTHAIAQNPALRQTPASGLRLRRIGVPVDMLDRRNNLLNVKPGQNFDIYLEWENGNPDIDLAILSMRSHTWSKNLSAPVNKGGFQMQSGSILCLPDGKMGKYQFTIPENFAPGIYYFYYDGLVSSDWDESKHEFKQLPLTLVCKPSGRGQDAIIPFKDLYPVRYNFYKILWNGGEKFEDMTLDGYSVFADSEFIAGFPTLPAGRYRVTIAGDGNWVTGVRDAKLHWPSVEYYLPATPEEMVGSVSINQKIHGDFSSEFTSKKPFDSMLLRVRIPQAGDGIFPDWLIDPIPFSHSEDRYPSAQLHQLRIERIEDTAGSESDL